MGSKAGKIRFFYFVLLAAGVIPGNATESPLKRHYKEGEVLRYQIEGTHSMRGKITNTYFARANVTVKKDSNGVFYEEFQWTAAQENGRAVKLPTDSLKFRQMLSLEPNFKSALPDLSKVDGSLIAPITDLMTFYVDDQLAIKHDLRKAGDRVYVKYGKPSSWADGKRTTIGYDCIDFDITLTEVNTAGHAATVKISHVPPPESCGDISVDWMRKPVSDAANNWFEVVKQAGDGYEAGAGKEVFDADIKILLPSGIIRSATMFNPVELEQRICKDARLTDCGSPEKIEIIRKIKLSLEE